LQEIQDQPEGLPDRLARWISHLLNPALLGLAIFAVLTWKWRQAWVAGLAGVVCYALVPGLVLLWLWRAGHIEEFYPDDRRQRGMLLLLGAACYFAGYGLLRLLEAPWLMAGTGCVFGVNALLVWLVNRCWKISIHAAGVSGAVCILLVAGGGRLWPGLLGLPLIAWARLRLKAHTPIQVGAGMVLGAASAGLLLVFLR
jgi:membrane-associated phospholipid phosphatase